MTDTPNDWTDNDLEQLSRIAPNAGAPSERAVKVRNIIEQNISGVMFSSGQPKILVEAIGQLLDAECKAAVAAALAEASTLVISMSANHYGSWGSSPGINSDIVDAIRALFPDPNYVKKQVASALEQAAKVIAKHIGGHRCGPVITRGPYPAMKSCAEIVREEVMALSPSPNYIALREAEARIAQMEAIARTVVRYIDEATSSVGGWLVSPNKLADRIVQATDTGIAALTEARDKLKEKRKGSE